MFLEVSNSARTYCQCLLYFHQAKEEVPAAAAAAAAAADSPPPSWVRWAGAALHRPDRECYLNPGSPSTTWPVWTRLTRRVWVRGARRMRRRRTRRRRIQRGMMRKERMWSRILSAGRKFKGRMTDMEERITSAAVGIFFRGFLTRSCPWRRWAHLRWPRGERLPGGVWRLEVHHQNNWPQDVIHFPPVCLPPPASTGTPSPQSPCSLLRSTSLP